MTIQTSVRKARFIGNGVNTTFPFTFKTFATTDLVLTQTSVAGVDTSVVSNFSIVLNTDQEASPGGVVTYPTSGAPMATGVVLTITSNLAATQLTDLTNAGGFFPKTLTDRFDYLTILIQQAIASVAGALTVSVSDPAPNLAMGTATQRANKYVTFDSAGNVAMAASLPSGTLSAASIGSFLNPQTLTESAAAVVPTNLVFAGTPQESPMRFGALGDGANDDTVAINKAIAGLNGRRGTVLFPAGTFKVSSQIVVPTGVRLIGQGFSETNGVGSPTRGATTILRSFSGLACTVLISGDDCSVDGIDFDNNLQGTGECLQVTGSRFEGGVFSTRNSGGDGFRIGLSASATGTASFATNVMTVTSVSIGVFAVGQTVTSAGVTGGTTITSLGTGTGGLGTYNLSTSPGTISAQSVSSAAASSANANAWSVRKVITCGNALAGFRLDDINGSTSLSYPLGAANANAGYCALVDARGNGTDGLQIGNANDNVFSMVASQSNGGCGIRFKTDGTNSGPRCNKILGNDCESNTGNDIQIDAATLPASAPGLYNVILGNRSVAVNSRIVDNSTGSLVIQWNTAVPGYSLGPTVNLVNLTGNATYNMAVGANGSPAKVYALPSGAADSILRGAVHKNGGALTDGWELNQNLVFRTFGDLLNTSGATLTPDCTTGLWIDHTTGANATITLNAPINSIGGQPLEITMRNTSGGALTVNFNAIYKTSGALSPANGFSRTIFFRFDGSNWIERTRSPADVSN